MDFKKHSKSSKLSKHYPTESFDFLFSLQFREKTKIENPQHEKMFIVYPTLETQEATAEPGRSFTHFLCSVCEENGGAIEIREIAK